MKRLLHALAALWPQRKEVVSPPVPPMSTGIRQHLAAVLRMERHVSECADSRICKSANETLGAVALNERSVLDVGLNLSEREQSNFANHQINDSTTRRLTESTAHQINDSTTRRFIDSPNQQIIDSPNHPTSLPRIPQPMPLLTILMLVFFMCLMAAKQVSAQAEPAAAAVIKPLQIGDTIPEELWHLPLQVVNHPKGKETITLNDYRGKLIILDFWATWCKSCIEGFPKLEDFQKKYAGLLGVLLVNAKQTGDTPEKVARTLESYRLRHNYVPTLPYLLADTIMQGLFPHQSLPHIVWIDSAGIYMNASHSEALTSANIESALSGDVANLHGKHDSVSGYPNSSLKGNDAPATEYHSMFSGHVKGAGFTAARLSEENGYSVYKIMNYPLKYFYWTAHRDILADLPQSQWRFMPEIELAFKRSLSNSENHAGVYCYELRMPRKITRQEAEVLLKEELRRIFGVSVSKYSQRSKVFVLRATDDIRKVITSGGIRQIQLNPQEGPMYFKNVRLSFFLDYIGGLMQVPFVYATDVDINVDVALPDGVTDFTEHEFLLFLKDLGIRVVEEHRVLDFALFEKTD